MTDPKEMAQYLLRHKKDFEEKGSMPMYTCKKCGETRGRKAGDLETAPCLCGGTMQVHFSKQ
ncbi:hypothetical protein HY839_00310 [Candidatus Azambacteria bacterium]|nr:hypothetical protein [Candidatus Azambacteria bacterium]